MNFYCSVAKGLYLTKNRILDIFVLNLKVLIYFQKLFTIAFTLQKSE